MRTYKNLMLWAGDAGPDPAMLYLAYEYEDALGMRNWGDSQAFWAKFDEVAARTEDTEAARQDGEDSPDQDAVSRATVQDQNTTTELESLDAIFADMPDPDLIVAAHNELEPEQQCTGQFHSYQLLTNAFLHGDIFHLLGNLLFLMIFGSRVNALIGTIPTVILYPVLAVAGSVGHLLSATDLSPHPALGASGAIMGLAGIYLVVFPLHKVHMAAWWRWGIIGAFRLHLKLFGVRGFWVVLFYIAFDILFTVLSIDDGVAHWAHLGGFIAGVVLALALLCSRQINARGGDILSAIFGRHAWALVGKPGRK
jgi:membrane associated rhomboid family serine protease